MRREIRAQVRERKPARSCRYLKFQQLEDRTIPSVTALEGLLAVEPGFGDTVEILDPIPMLVAGQFPDSPDARIDANTTASPYAGVVGVLIHSTQGDFLCSGTAISPTHILTAAHCLDVDDDGDTEEITGFTIYVNYGGSPLTTIEASSWIVHPDWTGFSNPSINDDLGIITLQQSLPTGVPIYPLYTGSLSGQVLELVGYGTTGTPSDYISGTASTTVKRVGQNVVGAYIGQDDAGRLAANEVWRADFDGPTSSTNSLNDGFTLGNDIETILGGGDSGGPAFVNIGGQLYLAGVNTHTAAVISGFFQILYPPAYGTILGGINVAPYASWINSVIGAPPDTTAPAAPTGLIASAGNHQVTLDWASNTEPDLAGYNVYRSTTSGGAFTKLNAALVANSAYLDSSAFNDTTYFYRVTAVDTAGNESAPSGEVSATPSNSGGTSPGVLYLTLQNTGTVGGTNGFTAANEDIIAFDGVNYQLFFDGSAFGLGGPSGGFSTDAVAVFHNGSNTEILMSFAQAGFISGTSLGFIYDADIVKFTVTAFNPNGSVAAGTWSWFFDGSDVGLSSGLFSVNSAEGIDSVDVLSDGRLLISTHGAVTVPGVTANDEDLLVFTPTSLGANTAGTWSWFFDGSDVGLDADSEDVVGFSVVENGGYTIYLSTFGNFSTNGVFGTGGDVFVFHPTSLGTITAGSFDSMLFLDGSAQGLGSNNVLDVSFAKSFNLQAAFGLQSPGRTSVPLSETSSGSADLQGVDLSAVAAAFDVHEEALNIRSATTFVERTPAAIGNNLMFLTSAAASSRKDAILSTMLPHVAVSSSTVAIARTAPEATDAATVAPASQSVDHESAEMIPVTPLWSWLTDADFWNEMWEDTSDGDTAGEPSSLAPVMAMPQAGLAIALAGLINARVRAQSVQDEEDPFAMAKQRR
jgi:hypothetical protein